MTSTELLEFVANIAAVLTFLGGLAAWCFYRYELCQKRKELEKQLKLELDAARKIGKQGAVGFLHLITKTGLTESEILQASFNNCRIKRLERLDDDGFAEKILFRYNDGNSK